MSSDPYVYPGTNVLKNLAGLPDSDRLRRFERMVTTLRAEQGSPRGQFDLAHLKAIHRHLFQDVYSWAGELRTIQLSKGGSDFLFTQFLEQGVADVNRRIVRSRFFQGSTAATFAKGASIVMGDLNHCHPFREGNGRTQFQFLKQLAHTAGHKIALSRLDRDAWNAASKAANDGSYMEMEAVLLTALAPRAPARAHDRSSSLEMAR